MHRPQRDAQAEREMIKRENKLFDVEINKAEFVKKKKEGKTRKQRGRNGRERERRKKEILYIKHYAATCACVCVPLCASGEH